MGQDYSRPGRAFSRHGIDITLYEGTLLEARFADDGQYYEAEIQGFTKNGQIIVFFVEYGNEQETPVDQVRPRLEYSLGQDVDARSAIDDEWYAASIVDYDHEFHEYTVVFESGEEQICDRSFLRPLPHVMEEAIRAEMDKQGVSDTDDRRSRSKTAVQKRLEAKRLEMERKEKAAQLSEDSDDEVFGGPSPRRNAPPARAADPPTSYALDDLLNSSSDEEGFDEPKPAAKPPPPKQAPKKSFINPIAAAAAAAVALKNAVVGKKEEEEVVKQEEVELLEPEEDLLLEAEDDPFADDPLFSDGEEKEEEQRRPAVEEDDDDAAEQAALRAQMYAKKEEDEEEEWLSGEECEALYFEDEQWYKAMVIGAEPDGSYVVEFTEYGNIQEGTMPSEMRRLAQHQEEQAVPGDDDDDDSDEGHSSPEELPPARAQPPPPKSVPQLKLTPTPATFSDEDTDTEEIGLGGPDAELEVGDDPFAKPPSSQLPPPPKKALPPVVPKSVKTEEERDFEEMQELLGDDEGLAEEHDLPDGPALDELEEMFEDDEFLDFLPDEQDPYDEYDDYGAAAPDEGDASAIFGIFDDGDLAGSSGAAVGGAKETYLRFALNREGLDAAEVVSDYAALREAAGIEPMGSDTDPRQVRKATRAAIEKELDFKSPKLRIFKLLEKQAKRQDVLSCGDTMAQNLRVMVVGAGIGGLRVACELALLGVPVMVVEKRTAFTRNNVLHLWSHAVADVQALGAAYWVPGFCKGNIHHCPIRKLQLCLLRTALLLGVNVMLGVEFEGVERKNDQWRAKCQNVLVEDFHFNVLIGADGESSRVASYMGFDKKETAYSLALGITANFQNSKTKSQLGTAEVNVARHFKQAWFAKLASEKGIELENMVYYKDDTHYFVCTAMKDSLISKGVLKEDKPELVTPGNIDKKRLKTWCEEVASYAGLPKSAHIVNVVRSDGRLDPDVAIFDFSRKFRAVTPLRAFASSEDSGEVLWTFVIGDALMEPFWPLGTGANRAVLSAWDAMASLVQIGMMGMLTADQCSNLQPLMEGAMSMYSALQASDPNTMKPEKFKMPSDPTPLYSYDPSSRYPRLKAGAMAPGEGELVEWTEFVPNESRVINTLSKADSTQKRRPSNPFKPKGAPQKAPPAKKVAVGAKAPVPMKKAAPSPSLEKKEAPAPAAEDLSRFSVAPPSFSAPAGPPQRQQPQAVQVDVDSRLSMAPPPMAAPVKKSPRRAVSGPAGLKPKSGAPAAKDPRNKSPKTALAAALANDPTYEIFDMSNNTIFGMKHREHCKQLGELLGSNTHLKELHLKHCDVDKVDVQKLCAGLAANSSLTLLDLEKNKIDNEGAVMIAEALRSNRTIRELNLLGQSKAFGDPCLTAFVQMFDYNVTLTKIIWRLDSRKSFELNKLLVRNNTIQKNLAEGREVGQNMIPPHCNVPELAGGEVAAEEPSAADPNLASEESEDLDEYATVNLNAIVPAKQVLTAETAKKQLNLPPDDGDLDFLDEDLYDEEDLPESAPAPVVAKKVSRPPPKKLAPPPKRPSAKAPPPQPKTVAAEPEVDPSLLADEEEDEDGWLDTVDLNVAVAPPTRPTTTPPPGRRSNSARPARAAPAPSRPSGRPPVPRKSSARPRKSPRPPTKAAAPVSPRRASAAPPPSMSKKLSQTRRATSADSTARVNRAPPNPNDLTAARAAVAAVTGNSSSLSDSKAVPKLGTKKPLSIPPPKNAPPDAVAVYADLSAVNDRFLALTDEEIAAGVGAELMAELARVRQVMIPLHTAYKGERYMNGAVAKWRSLNVQIPKKVNK